MSFAATSLRQTRALGTILFRYWARAGLPQRLRKDHGRRASGALLRIITLFVTTNWGWSTGSTIAAEANDTRRLLGIAWLVVALIIFSWTWGMMARVPGMRGVQTPLESPFLETLPLGDTSRVLVGLFERLLAFAIGIPALAAASSSARGAGIAVAITAASLLLGEASVRVLRVLFSVQRVAKLGVGLVILQVPAMLSFVFAAVLAKWRFGAKVVAPLVPVAKAAALGQHVLPVLGAILAVGVVLAGVIRLAERIGYDHVDVVPTKRGRAAKREELDVARIEMVLVDREPGGRWGIRLMMIYVSLLAVLVVLFASIMPKNKFEDPEMQELMDQIVRGLAALAAVMGFSIVTGRATRMVQRDVAARPMLAALPIAPADLLRGKARALVASGLAVAAPYLMILGAPRAAGIHVDAAWRGLLLLAAVALAAIAIVSVAFLTEGVASIRIFGGAITIETTLVIVPLLAVPTAPYAWSALVSLGALALLAFEARRSALRTVRWIDDADDFERETPVWRALLVFATFQASQTLGNRGLAFATELDDASRAAGSYLIAAIVLGVLTAYGRRDRPPIVLLPSRAAWLAAGVPLGAAAAGAAIAYARLLAQSGVHPKTGSTSVGGAIALAVVAIALAPVVEETFFRGWLQRAMAGELTRRAWLAPLLAAFAFAAVHPPLSFPAVLLLGLVAGGLYARTGAIGPGIVAHVTYNALALAFAAT